MTSNLRLQDQLAALLPDSLYALCKPRSAAPNELLFRIGSTREKVTRFGSLHKFGSPPLDHVTATLWRQHRQSQARSQRPNQPRDDRPFLRRTAKREIAIQELQAKRRPRPWERQLRKSLSYTSRSSISITADSRGSRF